MDFTNQSAMYRSKMLSQIPYLVHGFSTRHMGDGRTSDTKKLILKSLGLESRHFIHVKQVHGANVWVMDEKRDTNEALADALITQNTSDSFLLSVRVADCVPIVLVDPAVGITGVVHAGWRGTLAGIVRETVTQMKSLGADPKNIRAALGPHIGMCCYTVPFSRALRFRMQYPNDIKITAFFSNMWHLDIGWANYKELIASGLLREHIDAPVLCTSCQFKDFYSYRKDSKATFGEILGVVGWQKNIH